MSKTTFLGYVPSLKAKHEATIVEGKAIESKGGSIRYTLRGEYEGRKTLPKTVSKADFEGVYGFDAKAAEAVIMTGELDGKKGKVNMFHMVGIEDENDFTPEKIVPIHTMNDYGKNKVIKEMKKLEADTVGFDYTKITYMVSQALEDFKGGTYYSYEFEEAMRQMRHKMEDDIQRSDSELQSLADSTVKEMLRGKKKMNADTVGNPSPASVEPPAPSETPFPQEPSNENFSADYYCTKCDEAFDSITPTDEGQFCQSCLPDSATAHDDMDATTQREDFSAETNFDCIVCDSDLEDIVKGHEEGSWITCQGDYAGDENACGRFFCSNHGNREDFKCPKCGGYEDRLTGTYRDFEAFGFGKDDEPEEEKPKEQEFTVVLQEGDKLELTDIEETEEDVTEEIEPKEEDSPEESENEEKEAEGMFLLKDIEWETDGEDVDLPTQVWIPNEYYGDGGEPADWLSDNYGFLVVGGYADIDTLDDKLFEAVQAKVTRPVKEEEDEEKEEEGMSTLMKVGLGVGALAVGAAILGAEGEYRCPHCSNELHRLHITEKYTCPNCEGLIYEDFRDGYSDPADFMAEDEGESDYWAGENADWRAEATGSEPSNEYFSAECGDGGQNPCKECGGHPCPRCNAPHISDTDSIETEDGYVCLPCATDAETRDDYFRNDLLGGYMTRKEMLEQYPERKDEIDNSRNPEMREDYQPYQESYQPKEIDIEEIERLGMEKDEREIKKLMDEKGLTYEEARQMKMDKAIDQIPHWESEATGSEPSNEHFSAESKLHPGLYRYKGKIGMRKGWTECQECDDIVKQKDVNWYYIKGYGQATICDSCVGKYNYKKDRLSKGGRHGELAILQFMEQDRKDADTVGNPSPSGPSSTPEPAEATGSEPSNEQFSAVVDKEFYENVSGSLCPNCGRDGDLGHFSTLYWCDDCGNEGCDGCTDDCDCETKEAESKNLKMALGITAVGIGLAAILGKDKLTKLFDRFNL